LVVVDSNKKGFLKHSTNGLLVWKFLGRYSDEQEHITVIVHRGFSQKYNIICKRSQSMQEEWKGSNNWKIIHFSFLE